jgi:hypothetical protein
MLYKLPNGLVPAIPHDTFLTPADGSRRRVKAKTFADHQTHIIIQCQTYNTGFLFGSALRHFAEKKVEMSERTTPKYAQCPKIL